jgi:hypothetical protein
MKGQKPDYLVKFPVGNVWHKLGAAWSSDNGTISIVMDVGVAMTLQPGAKLVLVPPKDNEGAV